LKREVPFLTLAITGGLTFAIAGRRAARENERDDLLRLEAGLLRRSSVTVCSATSWLLRSFQVAPRLCYDNPQKNPERGTGGGQYAAMPRRMRCALSVKVATQTKTISSSARLRTRHVVLLEPSKILLTAGPTSLNTSNRYTPKVTLFSPIHLAARLLWTIRVKS
jgi:hypothetical protein